MNLIRICFLIIIFLYGSFNALHASYASPDKNEVISQNKFKIVANEVIKLDSLLSVYQGKNRKHLEIYSVAKKIYWSIREIYGNNSEELEYISKFLSSVFNIHLDYSAGNCFTLESFRINNIRTTTNEVCNYLKDYDCLAFNPLITGKDENLRIFHDLLYPSLYFFGLDATSAHISKSLSKYYAEKKDWRASYYFAKQSLVWYVIYISKEQDLTSHLGKYISYEVFCSNNLLENAMHKLEKKKITPLFSYLTHHMDCSYLSSSNRISYKHLFLDDKNDDLSSAIVLFEIGNDYINNNNGDSYSALNFFNKADKIFASQSFNNDDYYNEIQYANIIKLGDAYFNLANYNKAIEYYSRLVPNGVEKLPEINTSTLVCLLKLYETYNKINKRIKSLHYYNLIKEIWDNTPLLKNDILPDINIEFHSKEDIINTFLLLIEKTSIERSLQSKQYDLVAKKIEQLLPNVIYSLRKSDLYIEFSSTLAKCYYNLAEYDKCNKIINSITNSSQFESNELLDASYLSLFNTLANIELKRGASKEATHHCNIALNALESYLKSSFIFLPSQYKEDKWQSYDNLLSDLTATAINIYNIDPNASSLVERISLLSKGLLVYSDSYLTQFINNEENANVAELYKNIQLLRETNDPTIKDEISDLEFQFYNNSDLKPFFANWSNQFTTNYNDYIFNLKDSDIFIDFIGNSCFKEGIQSNIPDIKIFALVITNKGIETILPLSYESDLRFNASQIGYVSNVEQFIWQPLTDLIENKTRVFFSPSGILYNIPIEHLATSYFNKANLDFIRVSSIRELSSSRSYSGTAEIFGNMDYGINTAVNISDIKGSSISDALFYGFSNLKYSQTECDSINSVISSSQKYSLLHPLHTGTKATENTLKELSGQNVNLLHISSHALYIPQDENDVLFSSDLSSMNRSFICFTGANEAVRKFPYTFGDDGILTSQELSNLYFPNLDFVSISSCQSGIGDISRDGVFGLQRGFKKAGAKTMLVSLWSVNDLATTLLMSEFYRLWLSENYDMHSALRHAQQYVRTYSNDTIDENIDFSNPYFWSGFILIDAI